MKSEFRIQDVLWHVEIDEGQVGQVVHNLVINADQAMPKGGSILVSAKNHTEMDGKAVPLAAGKYVEISLKDEGMGVPPEHLEKIFDPYFTTKKSGSGLGLATSYAIIKRHGGYIAVDSDVGIGTTFTLYLPASEHCSQEQRQTYGSLEEGKGKILVMDDEPTIRDVASQMLVSMGYDVSTTRDGSEAISLYKRSKDGGEPFDAVIMDLTVPGGMGGKEAIEKLRDLDPKVKAIASSGYCNDPIMGNFQKYGFAGVLAKPYSVLEMNQMLRAIIHQSSN